jgi:hypothetical protein
MKTDQKFSYTGSSIYNLDNIFLKDTSVALFDSLSGIGGIDYMPYNGSTVTVVAGSAAYTPGIKNLIPSLNNKVYYFVSDTLYTEEDKDYILSQATQIAVSPGGITERNSYIGTFVFNNPNNYDNLYLIWDYTDSLAGGTGSYTGPESTKYIDVDFGATIGNSGISYDLNGVPSRIVLEWNGYVISDTGYVGLNSVANYNALIAAGVAAEDIKLITPLDGLVDNGTNTIRFNKFIVDGAAKLTVYSPLPSNDWSMAIIYPSLTSFYIDTDNGTTANVCSQIANTLYYHDGSASLPSIGDRIYTASNGSSLFNGGDAYHLISTTLQTVPPVTGGKYLLINSLGTATVYGTCDCTAVALPVVNQAPIVITQGTIVNLQISATNNPTSWGINSLCKEYTLTGGAKGSIFTITTCDGVSKTITVNIASNSVVCSSTLPVLTFGNGTITLNGACVRDIFPAGLSFNTDTGILSGIPTEACSYSISLIPTNCFGTGIAAAVSIRIETGIQLTPFAIDVENFSTSGAGACALDPVYSLLYHDGIGSIPALNDKIYTDFKANELFMGGSRWYKMNDSLYSIKICETGKVCETNIC